MAATHIYSTAIFVLAALLAVLLGFSPKLGALIQAIALAFMGGVSIVVFGLIAIAGARIWVDSKVDFSDNRNLLVAAITLVLGTGDFTLRFGDFALGGIGTATFGAIVLHALLGRRQGAGFRAPPSPAGRAPAGRGWRVPPRRRLARKAGAGKGPCGSACPVRSGL